MGMRHSMLRRLVLAGLMILTPMTAVEGLAQTTGKDSQGEADTNDVKTSAKSTKTATQVAAAAQKSIVVISTHDSDGKEYSLGTGFIISEDGLVATNMHVIGESRPIVVKAMDGTEHSVTSIHAYEPFLDVAFIRIDATGLTPLELGNSSQLEAGQPIVAIGHPHGLQFSVVSGVVSSRREIDGKPMVQLAIPIETGNSGGPFLDMDGKVCGILSLKSVVTANLGYALEIDAVKPLLESPSPIAIENWLRIGELDREDWNILFGSFWKQHGGNIHVEGAGKGIGRRSLCLSSQDVPGDGFDLTVDVRLHDEAGAAGLVFHSDGSEKHYGFYPSNGQLRLSRFDGPDVYSWNVLRQVESSHYRPGEWNSLKVRVDDEGIHCFVNERLVIESDDEIYRSGNVGLAQFRGTVAEFRSFRVASRIPSRRPGEESLARIHNLIGKIELERPPRASLVRQIVDEDERGAFALEEQAELLEKQALRFKQLALAVHQRNVQDRLSKLLQNDEEDIDLLQAALMVSWLDNSELDLDAYSKIFERFLSNLQRRIEAEDDDNRKLEILNEYFFKDLGFHGSVLEYYSESNSYINDVLDFRKGIPIVLCLLYLEMAQRIGLDVVGVGLPGHFVCRFQPEEDEARLIDVFNAGAELTREQAEEIVLASTGRNLEEGDLIAASKKSIVVRILHNLLGVAGDNGRTEQMLAYIDTIIASDPEAEDLQMASDRGMRAVLRFETGRLDEAIADVDWLLDRRPDGIDLQHVMQLRAILQAAKESDR